MTGGPTSKAAAVPTRYLVAQYFEGTSRISASDLAAATGLKKGDRLSPEKLNAVRRTILEKCAKSMPGQVPPLKCRMQITIEGNVTLTWILGEPE